MFSWHVEHFTLKRAEAKKIMEDAARERQEGIQGQWQPFREIIEKVRGNVDMACGPVIMRKGFFATRDGSWEDFEEGCKEKEKSSEWTLERIRDAHGKGARDEVGRLGVVHEIMIKRTDFLRRQSVEEEESPCRTSARIATVSLRWVSIGHGDSNNRQLVLRGVWRKI